MGMSQIADMKNKRHCGASVFGSAPPRALSATRRRPRLAQGVLPTLARGGRTRQSAPEKDWGGAALLGLDTRRRMGEGRTASGDAGGAAWGKLGLRHEVARLIVCCDTRSQG